MSFFLFLFNFVIYTNLSIPTSRDHLFTSALFWNVVRIFSGLFDGQHCPELPPNYIIQHQYFSFDRRQYFSRIFPPPVFQ